MHQLLTPITPIFPRLIVEPAASAPAFKAMPDRTGGSPLWVWAPVAPDGTRRRVDRVCFRRCFDLHGVPAEAELHLSARLHYHLKVNGVMIGVGPARSYPEFREIDAYDLRPLLRAGANLLEVEVLHWNLATFHGVHEPPGFTAQGRVVERGGREFALDTPGAWRCLRREGVFQDAPRLSFAQGPVEIVDLRAQDVAERGEWQPPVFAESGGTASLRPRILPPLLQRRLCAKAVASAAVSEGERLIGACLACDGDASVGSKGKDVRHAVTTTWIHSPADQTVAAGVWWGEHALNGESLAVQPASELPLRSTTKLPLRRGWNRLVVAQRLAFGYAEFCLAVPCGAGLRVHPERDLEGPQGVRLSGPLREAEWEALQPWFVDPAGGASPERAWRFVAVEDDRPVSPLRNVAWSRTACPPAPATLPLTLPAGQKTLVTLDMGQIVLGRFDFDVEAPAGTVLDVTHAEERLGDRAHVAKALVMYSADRWTLPGGRCTVESFMPRGFRYLDLVFSGHDAPVTLHAAGVIEQRYPHVFTGAFACSDEGLNQLWDYGCRTLELCSEDVFTDCPWRERTLYGGDLLPEMASMIVLTRDLRIVRQSLDVLLQSFDADRGWMQSRAPIPRERPSLSDYPLLTMVATAWYVRLSGDTAFAERAWPVFARMAATVARWRRPDGVYAPPEPAFIDHGRRLVAGPTCAFNAALTGAFAAGAQIARELGRLPEADVLENLAAELDARVVAVFFDRSSGSFRDLPLDEGGGETEGMPANSWPLLFCRSARAESPAVQKALATTLDAFSSDRESDSVSPYQMFYLLSALRDAGAAELAERAIRRVYAQMLAHPTGTLWEQSHAGKSLTHAWSSGCNHYLATAVLGVRMGFSAPDQIRRVLVAPAAASISWAKGRVPHPLGDVAVAWERRDDGLHLVVSAPEGVPVDVAPAGPFASLPCHVDLRTTPVEV